MSEPPISPVKDHRRIAFRCCELQPARRGLVGSLHLGDDAGERSVAQRILAHGEQYLVILALRIKHALGSQPRLLEARRVKIEARQGPERRHARSGGKTGRNSGGEEGGGGIVTQTGGRRCDFVQTRTVETAAGEKMIERSDAKGQHGSARRGDARHHIAQRGNLLGTAPRQGKRHGAHVGTDSNVPYMFH